MDQKKFIKVTVLGLGSPVPVQTRGGGAGLSGPSANDCGSPLVVNQAEGGTKTTGTVGNVVTIDIASGDEGDKEQQTFPHSRLNMISQMRRCNSLSSEGKKRKLGDTSIIETGAEDVVKKVEDPTAFVIMEALEAIQKCSKELDRRIFENPNTKREIKEIAARFKKGIEILNRTSLKEWFEENRWKKVEIPKYEADTQTDKTLTQREVTDVGIQVEILGT